MTFFRDLIFILCVCFLLYLGGEKLLARRYRRFLLHVVHVNGTRGKSSVVRLIDAGLREGGFRVVSKSTGTLPMILHADGSETEIRRRAPANIREQFSLLRLAYREKAQVLTVECMALEPELQRASQEILQADIGVITNVRIDHTDVMGSDRQAILEALLSMAPKKGTLFTAERELFPLMEKRMTKLRGRAVLTAGEEAFGKIDFPENVAEALAVCESLGVQREIALRGMEKFRRDPFAFEKLEKGNTVFLNAFSANDVSSTKLLLEKYGGEGRLVLLLNNRGDRPARAEEMGRLAKELQPAEVYLLGEQRGLLKRILKRALPHTPVKAFSKAEQAPLTFPEKTVLLGAGNIKGQGEAFTLRVRRWVKEDADER